MTRTERIATLRKLLAESEKDLVQTAINFSPRGLAASDDLFAAARHYASAYDAAKREINKWSRAP